MAKLGEILRPRPRIDAGPLDPAEEEIYEARIAERVARLSGHDVVESPDDGAADDGAAEATDEEPGDPDAATDEVPASEPEDLVDGTARPAAEDASETPTSAAVEPQRFRVPLIAVPEDSIFATPAPLDEPDLAPVSAYPVWLFADVAADPAEVAEVTEAWAIPGIDDREPPDAEPVEDFAEGPAVTEGVAAASTEGAAAALASPARRRAPHATRVTRAEPAPPVPEEHVPDAPRARRPRMARATARPTRAPARIPPYCPSCAALLAPPPIASGRCARCRQRIIVKHVDGRIVYLAQAAIPVFEAERRRSADAARFSRERARWLKLAAAAAAPAERVARLGAAPPSEKAVAGARAIFLTAVERALRTAKREHRWADASRLRHEQALAIYREMGSPVPPPAEIVRLHRDAVKAELRGIAEITRDAELAGATCCDACRADDGHVSRIAVELRALRLPHDGCPKGLCRCHWIIGAHHKTTVAGYLRRRERTDSRFDPAHSPTA